MQDIIIDEEFRFLLPTLDDETFRLLEESLLEHGCRDPLVLWNGILIDGYNRFKICTYHNIPFSTVDMEFGSREDVVIWIITNQISRRNLTSIQLSHFRGMHYKADKKIQGDSERFTKNALNSPCSQNENMERGSTAKRLAEHYNVAPATITRNAKLSAGLTSIGEISPEIKRQILHGEVRISKNRLETLASATPREVEAVVREIEEGTFVSRAPRGSGASGSDSSGGGNSEGGNSGSVLSGIDNNPGSILPEIRQLNTIISNFATNFNSVLQEISTDNTAPLKKTLRSYINELEELYQNL